MKLIMLFTVFLLYKAHSQEVNSFVNITQTNHYGEQVLQISVPSTITNRLGTIQMYDSNQKIVKEVKSVELVKAPFFTTIGVDELPAGKYQIVISTKDINFSQSISIHK